MHTFTASSSTEALQIVSHENLDLVITDKQMPFIDGIQLAKAIKTKKKELPIILLNAVGDESYKKHPQVFASVVNKPVKHEQLFRHLQNQFAQQKLEILPTKQQVLTTEFSQKNPLRILVAEDNDVNQLIIKRILTKLGYQADIVNNGVEVLQKIAIECYDVILMDVQMPEMDGLKTTKVIRSQLKHQPIIIALTANAMQGDKELCLQAGMDDYICKAINLEELKSCLEKAALLLQNNRS